MATKQQPQKSGSDTQNKAILVGGGFIAGLVAGLVIMIFTGAPGGSGPEAETQDERSSS